MGSRLDRLRALLRLVVNKAELVEILAGAASGSKSEAARALGAFLEGIRDGLSSGGP